MFNHRSLIITLAVLVTLGLALSFQTSSLAQSGGASGGGSGGGTGGGATTDAATTGGGDTGGGDTGGGDTGGGDTGGATQNPFTGDPEAIAAGEKLFLVTLGCAGCHGRGGGGGIGPNLTDNQWIYGSDDATLFETVHNGRPNGMPAFSAAASEEQIWQVIAFVRTLEQ